MIFLTNRNYQKFVRGKNGITYHHYDFCRLANNDYYQQGFPDQIENSGLLNVSSEIDDKTIQVRNFKKCPRCKNFSSLPEKIQEEYFLLRDISIKDSDN